MRVRIKICGLTRPEDARRAATLGVDAIGLNFYPPSPRFLDLPAARAVRASVPPFVTSVAVFVNPDGEEVRRVIGEVGVDMLQFHGTEPAGFCGGFGLPYLKAVGMREGVELAAVAREHPAAAALLLDVHDTAKWGGTGRTFDWSSPAVRGGDRSADRAGRRTRSRERRGGHPTGAPVRGGRVRGSGIGRRCQGRGVARGLRGAGRKGCT